MKSCIRMVVRKVCLRKGLSGTVALLCTFGFLTLYHFSHGSYEADVQVEDRPRNVKVPSLMVVPVFNLSDKTTPPKDPEGFQLPLAYPKAVPNVLLNSTSECQFSAAQPKEGQFDIQMSAVVNTLPYDNANGGVWKQGFEITYSMASFSSEKPLQVIVMPHSHNDPGWLKTFEDYYQKQTRNILNLMTEALSKDSRKKFVWSEISYLDLWWNEQGEAKREQFKKLVAGGQLEILTGGWVMNDEANTHYFAMLDQLMEGHRWMQNQLPGVIPRSGWANDPFGYSPTMAYLLRGCGLDAMLIQRAHYAIKKYLSRNKQLEFRWTQEWDRSLDTGILCQLMPFYSYDVPHTCGPDPKICCQFDFHRLPGSKVNCPWKVRPQAITDSNVQAKAETLADQYRKKSVLFKTNVLLVPLGDDFRWETDKEIRNQFDNYFKLMDYMNSHPEMKIHVQFGTLSDYFQTLRKTIEPSTVPQFFPSLAGDFFTYADRDDHYWSGYFTSRPYHKQMDRVLEYNLRMAEVFYSLAVARGAALESGVNFKDYLTFSRRALGLFQHHDGITGTGKEAVVNDYAKKMLMAIRQTRGVSQAVIKSLTHLEHPQAANAMAFSPEETYPNLKGLADHAVLDIKEKGQQVVTFVNSLAHDRVELVSVQVNSADVMVVNSSGSAVDSQLNPVFKNNLLMEDQFQLVFVATLPALGTAHYLITAGSKQMVRADVQYINHNPPSSQVFRTKQFPSQDFVLHTKHNLSAKFSGETGLLKALTLGSSEVSLDLDFVSYGTRSGKDKSGAYLFLPDKEAVSIVPKKPNIITIAGPLYEEVWSDLGPVKHSVVLSNSPGVGGCSIAIHNMVDVRSESNKEIAMRFRTSINNERDTFYTDLNGFQLIRRRTYEKISLQGNFYPMPTTALLQDNNSRLTLYSGQPLGVASLKKGWLEVILDRRLMQDDHRGLGQGVKDSVLTHETFRLVLERRLSTASSTVPLVYPSLLAQHTLDSLLHPPAALISSTPPISVPPPTSYVQAQLPCDLFLLNLRSLFQHSDSKPSEAALMLHRRGFDCGFDMNPLTCSLSNGSIKMGDIFKDVTISGVSETSLSLFQDIVQLDLLSELRTHIAEMQLKTYRLTW